MWEGSYIIFFAPGSKWPAYATITPSHQPKSKISRTTWFLQPHIPKKNLNSQIRRATCCKEILGYSVAQNP